MVRTKIRALTGLAFLAAGAAACTAIVGDFPLGNVRPTTPIEPPDAESNSPDGAAETVATDGAADGDAADSEGGTSAIETYLPLSNAANWASFDIGARTGRAALTTAGFDGRYVYYLTYYGAALARYDTRAPGGFSDDGAWSVVDLTALTKASGLRGAAFDGRYLYISPNVASASSRAYAIQYDTWLPFADTGSYSVFDLQMADASASSYSGVAFDGRYVYFSDSGSNRTIRYDTSSRSFTSPSAWESFTPSSSAPATGHEGAHLQGHYLYLPGTVAMNVRLDTGKALSDSSAWAAFMPGGFDAGLPVLRGFAGATSDDRYVYFAPYVDPKTMAPESLVLRYDSQRAFSDPAAYATFDTATLNDGGAPARGFFGAVYDGRFAYFVPAAMPPVLARYDTTAPFDAASSWETLDLTKTPGAPTDSAYGGGAFDGEYLYLVPASAGVALRFHAKTPGSIPSTYHGSFF